MKKKQWLVTGVACALLLGAACGGGDSTSDESAGGGDDAPVVAENRVTVDMNEYSFTVEGEAQAGSLILDFVNAGGQVHHAIVGKIDEGKTIEDVEKAVMKQGPPPPWFSDEPLDLSVLSPGQQAGLVIDAEEGTYVLLCFMPDPTGKPHVTHGMYQIFEVGPAGDAAPIEADVSVSMDEDGAEVPSVPAGESVFEVTNDGKIPAEFTIGRFAEGMTAKDVDAWFNKGQKGDPPVTFFGGTHEFEPGTSVMMSVDLEPGDYVFLTTSGEGKDKKDVETEFTVE